MWSARAPTARRSCRRHLRESIESELGVLREQLAEYEALQDGEIRVLEVDSFVGLPDALIRARIAAGMSQKALAERMGLKEQQIQRYEATHYASVAFRRIAAVADALGIQVHERIVLPPVAGRRELTPAEPNAAPNGAETLYPSEHP